MKANELRIGNYVLIENDYEEVVSIKTDAVVCRLDKASNGITQSIHDVNPILLTDKWFEIFERFYKDGEYWCIDINDYKYCFKYRDWANNWAFYQEFTDSPNEHDNGVKYPVSFDIQYVHQLQNLYFALQHEELKLR